MGNFAEYAGVKAQVCWNNVHLKLTSHFYLQGIGATFYALTNRCLVCMSNSNNMTHFSNIWISSRILG